MADSTESRNSALQTKGLWHSRLDDGSPFRVREGAMVLVTRQSYDNRRRYTADGVDRSVWSLDHTEPGDTSVATRLPRRWRLLATAFACGGVAMLPWLAALSYFVPRTATAAHWNVAWVGLDTLEALGLFATGRLIVHGDRRYAVTAALTGTALLIDAWFDILTSTSRGGLLTTVLMAGLVELPLSCLCFVLAFRAVPARETAVNGRWRGSNIW